MVPRQSITWFAFLAALSAGCGGSSGSPAASGSARFAPGPTAGPPCLGGTGAFVTGREPEDPSASPAEGAAEARGLNRIEIVVTDEHDHPLSGARVSHPRSASVTNSEGRAWLGPTSWDTGSPRGDRYWKTLTIRASGYATQVISGGLRTFIAARETPHVVRVRLRERALGVSGRVIDTRGGGVASASVIGSSGEFHEIRVQTDADGRFFMSDLGARPVRVQLEDSALVAKYMWVVPPATGLEIIAYRPPQVRGRLVAPPSGMHGRPAVQIGQAYAASDDELRFSLACLPGTHDVLVNGQPWRRITLREGEVVEGMDIPFSAAVRQPRMRSGEPIVSWTELDLRPLIHDVYAESAVVNPRDGDPPEYPEVAVVGFFDDHPPHYLDVCATKSSPVLQRVPLPSARLREIGVLHWQHGTWRQPAAAESSCMCAPRTVRTVTLRIQGVDGFVEDGKLLVRWPGSEWVAARPGPWSDAWCLPRLAPGLYDLVWFPADSSKGVLVARDLVVPAGEGLVDLGVLPVLPATRLTVVVEDESERPIPGAAVMANDVGDVPDALTDDDGRAEVEVGNPIGLVLRVWAGGFEPARVTVAGERLDRPLRVGLRRP